MEFCVPRANLVVAMFDKVAIEFEREGVNEGGIVKESSEESASDSIYRRRVTMSKDWWLGTVKSICVKKGDYMP